MSKLALSTIAFLLIASLAGCTFGHRYTPRDIPQLIRTLQGEDEIKRAEASAILGNLGPSAVPALIDAIKTGDPKTREWGIYALSKIGPAAKETIPLLTEALADETTAIRYEAARAIASIGPEAAEAAPALIKAMDDEDWRMQYITTRALGCVHANSPDAIDSLVKALTLDRKKVRINAANALYDIGPNAKHALPALFKALTEEEDEHVRGQVMRAIQAIGVGKDDIPALAAALDDSSWVVRQTASRLLKRFDADSIALLIEALQSERPEARAEAAHTLGSMGADATQAVPALIKLLDDSEMNVVTAATEALGDIGPAAKEALPALRGLSQKHPQWNFDWLIKQSIEKIEGTYKEK